MDKKEAKHKKYKKQKIYTYVSAEDKKRLEAICMKYKYDSIYKLLQYLIHCFLRVADTENDPIIEPVPDEIKSMFISPEEYNRLNRRAKKSSKLTRFQIQLLIPFDEYRSKKLRKLIISEEGMKLLDEIEEEFAANAEWEKRHHGVGSHEGMVKHKKPDQRKIKTVDDLK